MAVAVSEEAWRRWALRQSTEITTVPRLIVQSFRTNRDGSQYALLNAVTLEFKWDFEQRGFDETRSYAEKYFDNHHDFLR